MAEARSYDFDPVSVEKMLRWHLGRRREYFQLQPADREDLLASAMELFLRNYPSYDPAKGKLITWTEYTCEERCIADELGKIRSSEA